jgi:hypothetical protein
LAFVHEREAMNRTNRECVLIHDASRGRSSEIEKSGTRKKGGEKNERW